MPNEETVNANAQDKKQKKNEAGNGSEPDLSRFSRELGKNRYKIDIELCGKQNVIGFVHRIEQMPPFYDPQRKEWKDWFAAVVESTVPLKALDGKETVRQCLPGEIVLQPISGHMKRAIQDFSVHAHEGKIYEVLFKPGEMKPFKAPNAPPGAKMRHYEVVADPYSFKKRAPHQHMFVGGDAMRTLLQKMGVPISDTIAAGLVKGLLGAAEKNDPIEEGEEIDPSFP